MLCFIFDNEEIMINEAEQIETDLVKTNANHINDVNGPLLNFS